VRRRRVIHFTHNQDRGYASKTHPEVTVTKNYRHEHNVVGVENVCTEYNPHVTIQNRLYYLSADGYLMPAKKNQQPPDLWYFKQKPR
jgi:hypothetical protein